jgi:hypothetical protein
MGELFRVVIKDRKTHDVVEELKPNSERTCERIQRGVDINLNHEKYYSEIEPVKEDINE